MTRIFYITTNINIFLTCIDMCSFADNLHSTACATEVILRCADCQFILKE
jgi:hypothetical protein